jgi:sterol-4alpha-carboxylate 3-dehydrogenase (decarboxylating)
MSRVLVTGAAGFVGSHLVRRLVAAGHDVVATDLRPRADLPAPVQVADITDVEAMRRLVVGVEVVFHTASMVQTSWTHIELLKAVNHGATESLLGLSVAAGVARFIYVSSASVVYAGADILGGDESLPYATRTQSPYSDSKIEAEKAVLAAGSAEFRTISIRPHVVYGPGDGRFMPNILSRARAGTLRVGVGRGRKLSDFTYIDNLIDALVLADTRLAADASLTGRAYFVSNGDPMGFWDFIDLVLTGIGRPPIRGRVPYALAYGIAALVEWFRSLKGRKPGTEDGFTRYAVRYMCTHHYFDISRARRELGYEPRISTPEGVRLTLGAEG